MPALYEGMPFDHETVTHSLSEYVRGDIHTNGIESLWSMLKRAHTGTFHKLSPKHLDRYVQEFAARHNLREADTIDIMASVTDGMDGKRLRYREQRIGIRGKNVMSPTVGEKIHRVYCVLLAGSDRVPSQIICVRADRMCPRDGGGYIFTRGGGTLSVR